MQVDAELHAHRSRKKANGPEPNANPLSTVPATVQLALRDAMKLEQVPSEQFNDLLWIIYHESRGQAGVKNPKSTARGLFQLLKAQYCLNPNGEKSFGNAVEECQGGIRYVVSRYRNAHAARQFWEKHNWY
jgi:SLT domain-containing protein